MAVSEWAPIRLGDVCTKIGSGATPRGGGDVYLQEGPYTLIRSQNVYNDGFHHDGLAFIGEKHAGELANVDVRKGDVLLNITGDSVGLMQAIARVNRVFRDKPGGLVVDYLGLADELRRALVTYTEAGGTGKTALNQSDAVDLMLSKHEVCVALFHSFDWSRWMTGTPGQRLSLLPAAQEHILKQEDGKNRLLRAVTELSQAFALAVPHEEAIRIRDEVGFFQAVRAVLAKSAPGDRRTDEDLDHAIRQIISKAMVSDEVVDIFAAAGLKKPDISILSDEFLTEVRGMPQRNLAVELLQKLLKGEIRNRSRRNVVQARRFSEMLEESLRRYQNRAIETAKVIEELIQLAKDMRQAAQRGEALGLTTKPRWNQRAVTSVLNGRSPEV